MELQLDIKTILFSPYPRSFTQKFEGCVGRRSMFGMWLLNLITVVKLHIHNNKSLSYSSVNERCEFFTECIGAFLFF